MLNNISEKIICVKGNCDAEVDQMVLDFVLKENYIELTVDNLKFFVTHGHKYNTQNPPPMDKNDILIHGHTHISTFETFGNNNLYINPGSVSIPKESTQNGYLVYEKNNLIFKNLDRDIIKTLKI